MLEQIVEKTGLNSVEKLQSIIKSFKGFNGSLELLACMNNISNDMMQHIVKELLLCKECNSDILKPINKLEDKVEITSISDKSCFWGRKEGSRTECSGSGTFYYWNITSRDWRVQWCNSGDIKLEARVGYAGVFVDDRRNLYFRTYGTDKLKEDPNHKVLWITDEIHKTLELGGGQGPWNQSLSNNGLKEKWADTNYFYKIFYCK